jgi:hypothetical protein
LALLFGALTIIGLSACGAPAYSYVADGSAGTYYKVPSQWHQLSQKNLDAALTAEGLSGDGIWSTEFDGAGTPSGSDFLAPDLSQPFVFAEVGTLGQAVNLVNGSSPLPLPRAVHLLTRPARNSLYKRVSRYQIDPNKVGWRRRIVLEVARMDAEVKHLLNVWVGEAMIVKDFIIAKTFRSYSANFLRQDKSPRDHGDGLGNPKLSGFTRALLIPQASSFGQDQIIHGKTAAITTERPWIPIS